MGYCNILSWESFYRKLPLTEFNSMYMGLFKTMLQNSEIKFTKVTTLITILVCDWQFSIIDYARRISAPLI